MSMRADRYFFFGALLVLVVAAAYAAMVGAVTGVAIFALPVIALVLLAFLAIRLWVRSRGSR